MNLPDNLIVDHQSLSELELFHDNSKGISIFDMLNRTVTTGGKDNFTILFSNPSRKASEIITVQEVIKFLANNLEGWKIPFTKQLMDQVEVYYFSKTDPVFSENSPGQILEGIYYWLTRKDYKETAIKGTKSTLRFVLEMKKYINKFSMDLLPAELKRIFKQVNEVYQDKDIQMVCTIDRIESVGFFDLVTIDQWFRSKHKDKITLLIDIAYKLDVYLSMARSVNELKLTFPEIVESDSPVLEMEGLYHLFLKKPVSNDLVFGEKNQFLFLTGPNMAGKTTFLKSCGIAVYLAQLGMGVPAKRMKISPFNALFSSLNTTDNLSIGYSYFYSEVMRVRKAAQTLQKEKKSLMIFDELFKGTNIKDAFDGSMLVINGLLKWEKSFFILASHLTELANRIEERPSVFFRYFDSTVENGKPVFSYRICNGKSDERLGLIILQNENIENMLTPQ